MSLIQHRIQQNIQIYFTCPAMVCFFPFVLRMKRIAPFPLLPLPTNTGISNFVRFLLVHIIIFQNVGIRDLRTLYMTCRRFQPSAATVAPQVARSNTFQHFRRELASIDTLAVTRDYMADVARNIELGLFAAYVAAACHFNTVMC
jgi:hypothetical protein